MERKMMALMLAESSGRHCFKLYTSVPSLLSPLKKHPLPPNRNVQRVEIKMPETCEPVTLPLLLQMLDYENKVRLSPEFIEVLEKEADIGYDEHCVTSKENDPSKKVWISMELRNLQERVVQHFGYKTKEETFYAVNILRSALALHPNNEKIQLATNYLRFNQFSLRVSLLSFLPPSSLSLSFSLSRWLLSPTGFFVPIGLDKEV